MWEAKALDPISLYTELNYPDPMETAKKVVLWTTNPQLYLATFFPESLPPPGLPQDSANPVPQVAQGGAPPPEDQTLGADPASAALSQVPINTPALPQ